MRSSFTLSIQRFLSLPLAVFNSAPLAVLGHEEWSVWPLRQDRKWTLSCLTRN